MDFAAVHSSLALTSRKNYIKPSISVLKLPLSLPLTNCNFINFLPAMSPNISGEKKQKSYEAEIAAEFSATYAFTPKDLEEEHERMRKIWTQVAGIHEFKNIPLGSLLESYHFPTFPQTTTIEELHNDLLRDVSSMAAWYLGRHVHAMPSNLRLVVSEYLAKLAVLTLIAGFPLFGRTRVDWEVCGVTRFIKRHLIQEVHINTI